MKRLKERQRSTGAGTDAANALRNARYVPPGSAAYRLAKAIFDWVVALCAGIVTLIPLLALMLVVEVKDHGSPLYFQRRIGKGGETIRVAKLRNLNKEP